MLSTQYILGAGLIWPLLSLVPNWNVCTIPNGGHYNFCIKTKTQSTESNPTMSEPIVLNIFKRYHGFKEVLPMVKGLRQKFNLIKPQLAQINLQKGKSLFLIEMQSSGTNTRELLRLFSLEVASTPGTQSEICGWVGWVRWHHWQQVSSITQSQLWAARSISLPWSLLMHSVMSYSGMVAWAQQQSCPHGGGWELPLS